MWYFIVGIFGLVVGSFLNVVIYRWPREESFVGGRSKCPKCERNLPGWEMVPVVSWLMLGGKCAGCGMKISVLYPTVELMNAGLWMWLVWLGGWGEVWMSGSWEEMAILVLSWLVVSVLLVVFWIDLQTFLIPDGASVLLAVAGLLAGLWQGYWIERLGWAIGGGVFFWLLHVGTRGRGMGLGDVKLVAAMGLVLGATLAVGLGVAFLVGSLVGVGLLWAGKAKLGKPIPFGPFLVVGMWAALGWGREIIDWYVGMLGLV